eukprot:1133533-Pelagomonas_calceolata.AAC.2
MPCRNTISPTQSLFGSLPFRKDEDVLTLHGLHQVMPCRNTISPAWMSSLLQENKDARTGHGLHQIMPCTNILVNMERIPKKSASAMFTVHKCPNARAWKRPVSASCFS